MGQEAARLPPRGHRAARAVGRRSRRPRAAGAGTTAATACSRCCSPRSPTSTTSSRRSSPTRSSGTSSAGACCAAGWPPARRARRPRRARRRSAARADDWARLRDAWGAALRGAPAGDRRRAASRPARAHARRHAGRLRAHDAPLVGAGARRRSTTQALGDAPLYFVSSNTHSLVNLVTGTGARARGASSSPSSSASDHEDLQEELDALPRRAHRGLVGELPLLRGARLLRRRDGPELRRKRHEAERAAGVEHIRSTDRAARLRAGHRRSPASTRRGSTRGWAPSTPTRLAAQRRGDRQHRVPARPRRLQHPARGRRRLGRPARRLRPGQGGDAQRRRRRRDDLVGHPRRALGLDLLARQRLLRRRHRARTSCSARAWTTSAR